MTTKENEVSHVLGLDISTTTTGWCVIDRSEKCLLSLGFFDLSDCESDFSKADVVEQGLDAISARFNVVDVFIEENLQAFQPGKSSAATIVKLARFNGTVSHMCYKTFKFEPTFLNVNTARKSVGFKADKSIPGPVKDQVRDWVIERLPDVEWPTHVLKSGPNKGKTVYEKCCGDMSDAYVIAKAGSLKSKK